MILEKLRRAVTFAANRKTPELRETLAARGSALTSLSGLSAYNPDELVTRKGYAVYDQMQTDAQVAACLNIKKLAVLSRGWEVHPISDAPEDRETADFIRFCLQDMRGSILDALYKALDAVAKGFSVCELNYKLIESGPHRGRIGLASIKSKDPSCVGFQMDEFLNLTGVTGTWTAAGTPPHPSPERRGGMDGRGGLPPDKFVIYTYMPRYEDPHGQSDLRAAYKHWWSKDAILRFYNTYLEKYGSPTAKGSYRKGTTRQQQEDLLRVLDKIQQETAIVLPEDVTVELIEAQRGGEAGYLRALEYHDRQIARAILGQTLAVDEGARSGSYAQARVHFEVMRFYLEKLKRDVEESVVGEQIIRRLVDYNFAGGGVGGYPRFSLGPLEDKDLSALADLIGKLIDGKVIAPDEPWIREYLGVPGE
ncbi:MAG: DUF935 family protein [Armatimonadota bacterium]|nr:DUF935 family protein [Armatimonadota bacterium]